ncbi:MAG: hypothetical protein DME05_08120 [Candidatus Rokuibacteriota bacterium]|nr:MAG: hypothetical protein DME05_08120 [Candidatus Rokubacteria bacterium]
MKTTMIFCVCLACPCLEFVRKSDLCPDCARGTHCDWKTGARTKLRRWQPEARGLQGLLRGVRSMLAMF